MIQIGDKLEIKKDKRKILANLYKNNKHSKYQVCGVDPYHVGMTFILVKTYGDEYIVRVYRGWQHYTLSKDIFKKVK